ncbi:MAG: hypothetical protein LQ348_005720 [Seirophora lacunosa]|nr:MAG: hypothetical protein LQ348_005720 [Seirophora lacunosa]
MSRTTIVFRPGNPPANVRREANPDSFPAALEQRDSTPAVPPYIKSYATSSISDASCATPVPSLIPTLPFGKSNDAGVGDLSNSLYGQGTSGTTLEGCCNLCYFGLPNCVQAIYYSYQGCVVRQPAAPTGGTGVGVSDVCPNGQFQGLTYTPDLAPPFRSQGLLAGPCGQVYNNL